MTRFGRAEAGNALPEYALVLTLFSILAVGGLMALGQTTSSVMNTFQSSYNSYNLRHA